MKNINKILLAVLILSQTIVHAETPKTQTWREKSIAKLSVIKDKAKTELSSSKKWIKENSKITCVIAGLATLAVIQTLRFQKLQIQNKELNSEFKELLSQALNNLWNLGRIWPIKEIDKFSGKHIKIEIDSILLGLKS